MSLTAVVESAPSKGKAREEDAPKAESEERREAKEQRREEEKKKVGSVLLLH